MMNQSFVVLCLLIDFIAAHSWMTCPPSFITSAGRGGTQDKPCEHAGTNAIATEVYGGDRLKVGWTSNNHAGGYVRLSLVKFGQHYGGSNDAIENNFKRNVLKFVCYGHDGRKGPNNGDCNHPCNARAGCQYQSDSYDKERYDTTIGIPTNLEDGDYVLQAALLVGNAQKPYYSCAKLRVIKGYPRLNCQSNNEPLTYSCVKTGGPTLSTNFLRQGAQPGNFCYHFDGRVGTTDDTILEPPINVQCDSRDTCGNAVHQDLCKQDAPTMNRIIKRNGQSIMPGCEALKIIPPMAATCNDGIMNRDESDIDCGGVFCKECPPIVPPGKYHGKITQTVNLAGDSGNFEISVEVTKTITTRQCWQFIVQYNHPVEINSMWGDGVVTKTNDQKTIITIEKQTKWTSNPSAGKILVFKFQARNPLASLDINNPERVDWTEKNIQPQPATTLYVSDNLSECQNV